MTSGLDIVIVSYNTRGELLACLASIVDASPAGLGTIFVVDNASADGSAAAVRARWPAVEVMALDRNVGFGAANNLALRRAQSPLVLLLNSDTLVSRGAIEALVGRLEATGAVAAGPRLVDAQGHPEISFGPMLSPLGEWIQRRRVRQATRDTPGARRAVARLLSREREVDWVSGACLLVRRGPALSAGLFDERFFLYEEDVDFCAALRARGGRILFTPQAEIVHLRGRSMRTTAHTHSAEPPEKRLPVPSSHYDHSHLAFYEKHAPHWAPLLRVWLRLRGRALPPR